MVKLRFKRFTAWALSFCLLFSLAQTPALALAEPTSSQALFQPLQEPITKGETYQAEDRVKIIVELEDEPLLSYGAEI